PPTLTTPGVFINEVNAFPNSVVPVATAIPAFVGYTARASYHGKSYTGIPVRIESFQEYIMYFAELDDLGASLSEDQQYTPVYQPVPVKDRATADFFIDDKPFRLEPDPSTVFYLYNSIKLFYQNGGTTCFVVSVGDYGAPRGQIKAPADPLVNPNVEADKLTKGVDALEREDEPTMIVIPDATLLEAEDHAALCQHVLMQCQALGSRVGILDIVGGDDPDPLQWKNDITAFRTAVGQTGLNYGISYYPFLKTSVMQETDINFKNLGGGKGLSATLPGASVEPLKTLLANADKPPGPGVPSAQQTENALTTVSPVYKQLRKALREKVNILPPSGAMAGAYTLIDNERGVWHAPANISLASVVDTTVKINDSEQGGLNVDATTGKSVNVIRLFLGRGVVVWGARTLDGNSQDWRYLNVRRTMIMIEQSMKLAANHYVFQPNDANTWSLVKSMLNKFLTSLWAEGALVGATPEAAFSVAVGIGTTMTGEDILNGIMNITVKVAVSHPAEFIVITISQQMQTS
ncbi:MAG TPA: phage tail sheath C-terminal domain-containing protein, partial [Candidatus Didemnitutus sp.]|nr:phage tail sheath C-terminal domain-containing protein [Candidatus Didemnitutus sp.]